MKKLLLISLLLPIAYTTQIYTSDTEKKPIEFAFDIHGVLIQKSLTEMARAWWNFPQKMAVLKGLANLSLIKDVYQLIKQKATGGKYLTLLEKTDPALGQLAITMANAQIPIEGMPELVKILKEKGYTLRIASDIDGRIFKDLKEKYPEYFSHFSSAYTVDYRDENALTKKDDGYFKGYNLLYNPEGQLEIIFIDDKQPYVDRATRLGISGIHFTGSEKLKKDLATHLESADE